MKSSHLVYRSFRRRGRLFIFTLGLALMMLLFQGVGGQDLMAQAGQSNCQYGFLSHASSDPNCLTKTTTSSTSTSTSTLPSNFQDVTALSGLYLPTSVRFSPDGRVYVAQKGGIIQVFSSLSATTPTVFADLSPEVDDYWDRGLLGMALDPNFPTTPYIYVLYTYDAPIGGTAPVWNDACPTPPGPTTDGCVVSGRLSRLTADSTGNVMVPGSEQVFINDWCQQFPSHSIGQLFFGQDGALYASAGEGANFNSVDYGQFGNTYSGDLVNPCGDPPGGAGVALSPPTAEGGALRSQSLQRNSGDPAVLNGDILRLDPATGQALPTNPLYSSSDPNARRIIAQGLRNPFRFTFRPGTNEIWIGDVGWNTWEEIDRIANPTSSPIKNFGWPCYEGDNSGSAIQSGYQSANLNICNNLYSTAGSIVAPYYSYQHGVQVVPGETCPTNNGSAVTGITFYNGGSYPSQYDGALFFADKSRNCIWAMMPGSNGLPDRTNIINFVSGASNPVDLEIGPGGDLFYANFDGGTIQRIIYSGGGNQPPVAVINATPTNGPAPLTVSFDGTGSYDPDPGDAITSYSWDLNGDGVFGDSTSPTPSYTYTSPGNYTVGLIVTDKHGATGSTTVVISANNTPPTAVIDTPPGCPSTSPCWAVGDTINFSGHATDAQEGTLPAGDLSWAIIVHHCPTDLSGCHTHTIQTFTGVSSGSFSAPDHDYPAYLEIQLTATDSGGLQNTTSVLLYPKTVNLTLNSNPSGLQLVINGITGITSFIHTVIVNSNNTLSATTPQTLNGVVYGFQSWSDGGAQTHTVVAGTTDATYTATYSNNADVGITKNGTLSANKKSITYTIQVKNNGPAPAQAVNMNDALPTSVQYVSTSTTQGTCSGTNNTVTCSIGTISNGQTVTVRIVVNVLSKTGITISNTATVNVSPNSPDLNTANDSSTFTIKTR